MVFANNALLNRSNLCDSNFTHDDGEYAIYHMLYLAITLSDRNLNPRMFALQIDVIMKPALEYINNLFFLTIFDTRLLDSHLALIWITSWDYKFWEKVMAPDREMMDRFAKMTGLDKISIPKMDLTKDDAQPQKG